MYRSRHPEHCIPVSELYREQPQSQHKQQHLLPDSAAVCIGAGVLGSSAGKVSVDQRSYLTRFICTALQTNVDRAHELGWCVASKKLLNFLEKKDRLIMSAYTKAVLHNKDMVYGTSSNTKIVADDTWVLVPYQEAGADSFYLCVMQVEYFASVYVTSNGQVGFSQAVCTEHKVDPPVLFGGKASVHHIPFDVAVGKMWLAQGCTPAMGAVGCTAEYDIDSRRPPDIVVIPNIREKVPPLRGGGQGRAVYRDSFPDKAYDEQMFYGQQVVAVADIRCLLGPAKHPLYPHARCFLTNNKCSGKIG